jgi:hypothetical protein
MRLKAEAIFDFGTDGEQSQNKIVLEYRYEYKTISEILDGQPEILGMAHRDLEQLSKTTSRRGRKADFTSENLFRAILVMQREGLEYREASVRIAESETLQNFCRLRSNRRKMLFPRRRMVTNQIFFSVKRDSSAYVVNLESK